MSTDTPETTAAAADSSCPECGFNDTFARTSLYKGSLKLFYAMSRRGGWYIGTDKVLKELPTAGPVYEPDVLRYMQKNTTIPVPNVVADWVDGNGKFFLLMDRIPGKRLEDIWSSLTQDQKERIAEQVARYIDQLRPLKSDKLQSLSGGPVYSSLLFGDKELRGPTADLAKISDYVMPAYRAKVLSQDTLTHLRSQIPEHGPFTFTHNDLSICNIMVDDNLNVSGILDWEWSGYFPVWWEYTCASIGFGNDDFEWKVLVRDRLSEKYEAGRAFWKAFHLPRHESEVEECS